MVQVTLRLDERMKEEAEALAGNAGIPLSEWIRSGIRERIGSAPAYKPSEDAGREPMVHLGLRLKRSEFLALRDSAELAGMPRQRYLIAALRYFTASENAFSAEDVGALRDATHELFKVGNNLNQIARCLNAAAKAGRDDPESWKNLEVLLPFLEQNIFKTQKLVISVIRKTRWRTRLEEKGE